MIADRPTAVFRADASEEIGGGHVMRCLTLAGALTEAGWHVGFAVNAQALAVVPSLAGAIEDILVLGEDDEASALTERWPDGVTLLAVDHYGRDMAFELRCRPWAAVIMAIDDLANRRHRVDVLLDQTHGRSESDYRPLTGPECRLLLGPQFALLRPQFRRSGVGRWRGGNARSRHGGCWCRLARRTRPASHCWHFRPWPKHARRCPAMSSSARPRAIGTRVAGWPPRYRLR